MIGNWFRELLSRSRERPEDRPQTVGRQSPPPPSVPKEQRQLVKRSHGLSEFVNSIADESGLAILDLGEISQASVSFITNLGHRLYSVDFLRTLDSITTPDDPPGGPSQRNRIDAFLDQTLGFEDNSLDGALIWDSLEYLARPLLLAAVDRLSRILRPGAFMLAFFHTSEKAEWVPSYTYRIEDPQSLHLALKTQRQPVQLFNNRGVERLFEGFGSVKFFLSRDQLREVIVRR